MGRAQPSIGRPPAAFRRDARAKKAKATINKVIPSLLSAHPRARRGIEAAELIVGSLPRPALRSDTTSGSAVGHRRGGTLQNGPRLTLTLTLRITDTLTAAHSLLSTSASGVKRVAILNMASPLSPGGGFLSGATSQEETLCMRTTLLPSLRDDFYRLPEVGCVYTPDVLVFRDPDEHDLDKRDRWLVDVVTAAMLRLPETEVDGDTGHGRYVHRKDRELVVEKMRAVMSVFRAKGAAAVVLGAWGCGAYGNPVGEIARAWRRALLGGGEGRKSQVKNGKASGEGRGTWEGLEVVFAVKDANMAEAFMTAFGEGLEWAEEETDDRHTGDEDNAEETRVKELQERISELQLRVDRAPNERLRSGLEAVLLGLKSQLPTRDGLADGEGSGDRGQNEEVNHAQEHGEDENEEDPGEGEEAEPDESVRDE